MWGTSKLELQFYADTFYYNCSLNIYPSVYLPILSISPPLSSCPHRDRQDKVKDLPILAKQQQLK